MEVKKSRNFSADEQDVIEMMIEDGYTRERAEYIVEKGKEVRARWAAERNKPVSEERMKRLQALYERMQAEATAGLKE